MNAIKIISAEAKKISRRHPGKSWKECIKEASRKYRAHHHHKKKSIGMAKRKRRISPKKRSKTVKRIRRLHSAEGRAIRSLGSLAGTKRKLRDALKEKIGREMYKKSAASTKRVKKKIQKRISADQRLLRNL